MNHLAEARARAIRAERADGVEWAQLNALLAIAHIGIAIAERLPPLAEPPSARVTRLRREEKENESGL